MGKAIKYDIPFAGTLNISELMAGDIIGFHHNTGLLPKKIHLWLKRWAKIHYGVELPMYYNHTATVIFDFFDIIKRKAEAVKQGYVINDLKINLGTKDLIVFRYSKGLSAENEMSLYEKSKDLAFKNIEYEVLNFGWWPVYILSNGKIDISPKGDKAGKKLFCFETSCMLLNAAIPELFDRPDKQTTVDLIMDIRFQKFRLINE